MKNIIRKIAALLTVFAVVASMAGCTSEAGKPGKENNENKTSSEEKHEEKTEKQKTGNLMEGVTARAVEVLKEASEYSPELNDFAIRLFKTCREIKKDDENMLISPLSVLFALAMTANGADAETLAQMEKTLGITAAELNEFAYAYRKLLAERGSEVGKLELANSIWFTSDQRFKAEQSFLQLNSDYYNADIFAASFDAATVKDINAWVNEKTDGMIPQILNSISDHAVMFLINALAFDAKWIEPYYDFQVYDDTFTTAAGEKKTLPYLHNTENVYIGDENADGFVKYYKGGRYAFAALLPKEGMSVDEYLAALDGAHLNEMLVNRTEWEVYTSVPKFETEYSVEMTEILKGMGMTDAFDPIAANFSKLGKSEAGNVSIDGVVHKTFIAVDENGTKAGAATMVMMADGAEFIPDKPQPKEVYLTRPFIYMLIDCETNSPFFIGVMDCPEA